MEIGVNVISNTTLAIQLLNIFRVLSDKEQDAKLDEVIRQSFVAPYTGEETKVHVDMNPQNIVKNLPPELIQKIIDTPVEEQEGKNKEAKLRRLEAMPIASEIPLGEPEVCNLPTPKDLHEFNPQGMCIHCRRTVGEVQAFHNSSNVVLKVCPERARANRQKRIQEQSEQLHRAEGGGPRCGEPGIMNKKPLRDEEKVNQNGANEGSPNT